MYRVTIQTEERSPQTFKRTPHFVARDENHTWRTYGEVSKAPEGITGRALAEWLYHSCEVGKVEVIDGVTVVEILETDAEAESFRKGQS